MQWVFSFSTTVGQAVKLNALKRIQKYVPQLEPLPALKKSRYGMEIIMML
jgi:hypothetical protein